MILTTKSVCDTFWNINNKILFKYHYSLELEGTVFDIFYLLYKQLIDVIKLFHLFSAKMTVILV